MTFPAQFRILNENNPNFILREDGSYFLREDGEASLNTIATADSGNRYNICQRTGFKQKPVQLSTEWTGSKVRTESYDKRPDQLGVRARAESLEGPKRPEPADVFVSTSTAPSDL